MKINLSKLFDELYPINRSLLGQGYDQSLKILNRYINFKKIKYKSGSKIFDWKVPNEWIVKEAYIEFKKKRILDYKNSNLHIINYSYPMKKNLNLNKLKKILHTIPSKPKYIPYITSYYKKNIGFCSSNNFKKKLKKGIYNCVIDTKFKSGFLVNGLSELKGKSIKTNLISTYLCHPSLANNELSGPLVMVGLYNKIKNWKKKNFTYKFLVNPETIGSLCFLKSHGKYLKRNLSSGLVLTCLGGKKNYLSYKQSKNQNSNLDRILRLFKGKKIKLREYDPAEGSDERQYNSPGFDLPVGNIIRDGYMDYAGYHNSGDNKKYMNIKKIEESIDIIEEIFKNLDLTLSIKRYMPYGELMLGKRNLYPTINSDKTRDKSSDDSVGDREELNILLTILGYADGKKNILDIIELKNLNPLKSFNVLKKSLKMRLIHF